jgi:hypothetical protein
MASAGVFQSKWAETGWERSRLGCPISPEQDEAGGRLQRFQLGSLFLDAPTGRGCSVERARLSTNAGFDQKSVMSQFRVKDATQSLASV